MSRKQTKHIEDVPPAPESVAPADDQAGTFFTIPELARRWRTSRHTVAVAIRAGRLQAFKVGERIYRIREAEVIRYEQQHMAVAS